MRTVLVSLALVGSLGSLLLSQPIAPIDPEVKRLRIEVLKLKIQIQQLQATVRLRELRLGLFEQSLVAQVTNEYAAVSAGLTDEERRLADTLGCQHGLDYAVLDCQAPPKGANAPPAPPVVRPPPP